MNHNEELGKIVWRFIDRMSDYCAADPAEKILDEFVKACKPIMDDKLDQTWKEKYGYTYTEYRNKVNEYD